MSYETRKQEIITRTADYIEAHRGVYNLDAFEPSYEAAVIWACVRRAWEVYADGEDRGLIYCQEYVDTFLAHFSRL